MSDLFGSCLGWTGGSLAKRTVTAVAQRQQFESAKKRRAGGGGGTPNGHSPDEGTASMPEEMEDEEADASPFSTAQLRTLLDRRDARLRREIGVLSRRCDALEAENAELRRRREVDRLRADSLGRSVRVLGRDVAWTYSAPDIPRRHWDIRGHDASVGLLS